MAQTPKEGCFISKAQGEVVDLSIIQSELESPGSQSEVESLPDTSGPVILTEELLTVHTIANLEAIINGNKMFLLKVGMQLISYLPTAKYNDDEGESFQVQLPLDVSDALVQALVDPTKDKKVLFETEWQKCFGQTDPRMRRLWDENEKLVELTKLSIGLTADELVGFMELLVSEHLGILHRRCAPSYEILCRFKQLLADLEHHKDSSRRVAVILRHREKTADKPAIYPLYGKSHAAYIVILPKSERDTDFVVAIVNGGAGKEYVNSLELGKIDKFTQWGMCVLNCDEDCIKSLLDFCACRFNADDIFEAIAEEINYRTGRKNCKAMDQSMLFKGETERFAGKSIFVLGQKTGNCMVHNLLQTFRFIAHCYEGSAEVEDLEAILEFEYALFDSCINAMDKIYGDAAACHLPSRNTCKYLKRTLLTFLCVKFRQLWENSSKNPNWNLELINRHDEICTGNALNSSRIADAYFGEKRMYRYYRNNESVCGLRYFCPPEKVSFDRTRDCYVVGPFTQREFRERLMILALAPFPNATWDSPERSYFLYDSHFLYNLEEDDGENEDNYQESAKLDGDEITFGSNTLRERMVRISNP